jgi:hypothetical protein
MEEMIAASRTGLAGVLIACLLIHPAIGAVTWAHFEKAAVKRDVSERLRRGVEEGELVILVFPREKARHLLNWEGPREFEYQGRMYDLVETQVAGDTVVYKCLRDDEETRLNNRLKELALRESGVVLDPGSDGGRLDGRSMTSHGAVVCDGRIPNSGWHRFGRPSCVEPSSVAPRPPTPPPRPA